METNIGRKHRSRLRQLFIHLFAKRHDIIPRHHLHIENKTRAAIVLHILFRRLIPPLNRGNIFESDDTACHRVRPNDLLLQFIFGKVRDVDLQRTMRIALSAYCAQTLQSHFGLQNGRIDAISGQTLRVNRDGYLFGLLPHNTQFAHFRNSAQTRADLLGILLQFTRTSFCALHGDEQRGGIPEIINDEGL